MQIIRKVLIKQVITTESKARLKTQFQSEQVRLERECEQLLFEQRKLTNKLQASASKTIEDKFAREIAIRKEQIALLTFKIEQVDTLAIGSEIVETEMEALVDVDIGMAWEESIKNKTIVIKDNQVIRMD